MHYCPVCGKLIPLQSSITTIDMFGRKQTTTGYVAYGTPTEWCSGHGFPRVTITTSTGTTTASIAVVKQPEQPERTPVPQAFYDAFGKEEMEENE